MTNLVHFFGFSKCPLSHDFLSFISKYFIPLHLPPESNQYLHVTTDTPKSQIKTTATLLKKLVNLVQGDRSVKNIVACYQTGNPPKTFCRDNLITIKIKKLSLVESLFN